MSDKTEEPTARRLQKAREKGDVGASPFASQALGFFVAVAIIPGALLATSETVGDWLRGALTGQIGALSSEDLALQTVALVLPFLLVVAATSALATLIQTGALFAPSRITPDLGKLNPIQGLGGLFSKQRLWAVLRSLLTAMAVAWLATRALEQHAVDLAFCLGQPKKAAFVGGTLVKSLATKAALLGLAVALIDVLVSRRSWLSKLRMTKAEIKREYRESEGDPQMKAARERARMEMLAAATIQAVREATVVIVNPQHLATALRYREDEDEAPTIVANGEGDLAKRIQEAARAYGIPIVRDVPVARALRELEPGDEIPEALYEVVAEILREVWEAEETENAG